MAGPALGKLKPDAEVAIVSELGEPKIDGEVYIHLDVEHEALEGFVEPRAGRFLAVREMEIDFSGERLPHEGGKLRAVRVIARL